MSFRELQRIVGPRGDTTEGRGVRRVDDGMGVVRRLLATDDGQDLIEYALLTGFVGLVGVIAFQMIGNSMSSVFQSWNSGVQSVWETPLPASSS